MPQQDLPAATSSTAKRRFHLGALGDLLIVVATLVASKQFFLPWSQLYAGPISTLSAIIVATVLLRRRGMRWADLGFRWPENWLKTLGLTVLTFAVLVATIAATQPIADYFFVDVEASGRFDHIEGDVAAYLVIMLLVWTHGSFFEELLFRAFFINRASHFLGGGLSSDIIAATVSAVFFGYRHYYYQGMHGALITGALGFAFAMLYIWFGKRNILPLIFAHGIVNSLSQTSRFLGLK